MAKLRSRLRGGPRVETLEPRILYSADPAPVAIVNELATALVQPAQDAAGPPAATAQSATAVTEWVVIDSRVSDHDSLIADLQAQRDAGRQIAWLVVDQTQDGVSAISALLAGQDSVQAVHLVAHGEAGSLLVGRDAIDLDTLRARAGEFAAWSDALTGDADLLVYGCDVAAGEQGGDFVHALAVLTGADVAASVDSTGVLGRGGDWQLETETGRIEAAQAFGEQTRERWDHLLNAVPTGAETRVNNVTSSTQQLASGRGSNQAVALPGGGAFVVWQSTNTDLIMGRLISPAGVPVGSDIQISSNGFSASEPAVAFDTANNRIVVAWTSAGEDGSGDGIFSRVLDLNGAPVAPVAQVNQASAGNQNQVAVAVNSAGFAVFTWTDYTFGSTVSIAARGIDYATATAYSQLIVNDSTGSAGGWADPWEQKNSSIAFADNGEMLVVWESKNQDGAGKGVYGQWFDSSLVSRGSEFQISTATKGDQFAPVVAGGAGGEFVVGWTDNDSKDSIYARQYRADTTAKSAPFELQPLSLSNQGELSIAMTAGGGFVVAYDWDNTPGDGDQQGIYVGEYASDGSASGSHGLLNITTNGQQTGPTILLSGGSGYVIWQGNGPGDSNGIVMRGFDLVAPAVLVTPAAGTSTGESGGAAVFSVRLSTAPAANVVVNLSSSRPDEGSVSTSSLTFTTTNWNVAQTVTVTGIDDTYIDGTQTYMLIANPSSPDPQYDGLANVLTTLQNSDNDTQNIILVTTLADTAGGDVSSISALYADKGSDGRISLREALDAANATANGSGGVDIIRFDPGLANGVISLGSALSTISQSVWIDAITGTGFIDRPMITLDGNNGSYDGLIVGAGGSGSTISGLAVIDFGNDGIVLQSDGNTIEHNHLGIRSDGVTVDGNRIGLHVSGSNGNAIRNNLISGNSNQGIHVVNSAGNAIEDNRIGVDWLAASKAGNGAEGIQLTSSASNLIRGNTIGGNASDGLCLYKDTTRLNVVTGNSIGTNSAGTADLGNMRSGIAIHDGADTNQIGGVNATDGNLIRFNAQFGVHVYDDTGVTVDNPILSNRIYSNGHGIGLGVTGLEAPSNPPNDPLDADTGGNNFQNTPVLASAVGDSGVVQISGQLDSAPSTRYRIQFFASPTASVSGFGEGATYIGYTDVVTDGTGLATFSVSVGYTGSEGAIISATATRYDAGASRWADTSPFSANVVASFPPIWGTTPTVSVAEGPAAVVTLSATDPDGPSGSIVYSIVGGSDQSRFQIVSSQLQFVVAPDFEAPTDVDGNSVYNVRVQALDVAGLFTERDFAVTVRDVNEPPVIQGPTALVVAEDQAYRFGSSSGQTIQVLDPDLMAAAVLVEIRVDTGVLALSGVQGLVFAAGDGASDPQMRFTGSLQDVTAALASLSYMPAPDYNGAAQITIEVSDPSLASPPATLTIALAVSAVNDDPVLVQNVLLEIPTGLQATVGPGNLMATDVDDSPAQLTYAIQSLPPGLRLMLDGNTLGDGDRFTQADVNSGRLTVVSSSRSTVVSVVQLQLQDSSGGSINDIGLVIKSIAPITGPNSGSGSGSMSAGSAASNAANSGASTLSDSVQTPSASGAASAPAAPVAISPSGIAKANGAAGGRGSDQSSPVSSNANRQAGAIHQRDSQRGFDTQLDGAVESWKSQGSTAAGRLAMLAENRRDPGLASAGRAGNPSQSFSVESLKSVLQQRQLLRDLDRVREQVGEKITIERNFVASSAAVSASVSIGYVIWLIRGGVLVSSLLASIPAWSSIDPLPILSNAGGKKSGADDDESLEELLSKARRAGEAQASAGTAGDEAPAGGAEVAAVR